MLIAGLVGCQTGLQMRVLPGSTIDNLVLEISDDGKGNGINILEVAVYTCAQVRNRPLIDSAPTELPTWWLVQAGRDVAPTGNRVRYGVAQPGFSSAIGPAPLEKPGCYFVRAEARDSGGGGRTALAGFSIESDGSVTPMSRSEHESIWQRRGAWRFR